MFQEADKLRKETLKQMVEEMPENPDWSKITTMSRAQESHMHNESGQ